MYGNCFKIQTELFRKLAFIAGDGLTLGVYRGKRRK